MSISEQIIRIKNNIASAYNGLEAKNANIPLERNSANLRATIDSIDSTDALQTYSQENPAAASFISEIDYTSSGSDVSCITTYAEISSDYDKHKGAGTSVNIRQSGELILVDGYTSRMTSRTVSAGTKSIYNLTPGVCSFYAVIKNDRVIQSGTLFPTGTLRMIHPTYMGNVRDLGGWACDGGSVRYGKLYRGCAVYNRQDDINMLHDVLGIRCELDLRWESEIQTGMEAYGMDSYYSLIGRDVNLKHIDGAWYNDPSTGIIAQESNMKEMLAYAFDAVERDEPLYFHCVSGADRTGTLAMILEALLGVSGSDIDKDYELTSFFTGVDTDNHARRRNESDWRGLIAAFDGYSGTTLRDRVVNWVETLGISIDKINAFRLAMIDGNPAALTSSVNTATVTKALTGVTVDNTETSKTMYQPYSANVLPDSGKVISAVQIAMGGVDITDKVFRGVKTILRHSVSMSLRNCTSDSARKAVVSGECFCCRLTASTGYTLENATIQITMGGISVQNYYSEGIITIPNVTGDIEINVTAVPTVLPYANRILQSVTEIEGSTIYNGGSGYKDGYRYNSSYVEATEKATAPSFTTGFIHLKPNDVVRIYGEAFSGTDGGMNTVVFDNNGNKLTSFTPSAVSTAHSGFTTYCSPYVYDSTNNVLSQFTWSYNGDGWIKFTLSGRFDPDTSIITINEEL